MPYIPAKNRPGIDECVNELAEEMATAMIKARETAEIGARYRTAFLAIAKFIARSECGHKPGAKNSAGRLAQTILATAADYGIQGGWTGELNYAITMLIQKVPYFMHRKGVWSEPLRYWIYAETVGALTRTAYDLHKTMKNDYIGNGLAGVFEDIKDEYKRRVNTAYEAAQIRKSGDCYDFVPFRTALVPVKVGEMEGWQEVMLPQQKL